MMRVWSPARRWFYGSLMMLMPVMAFPMAALMMFGQEGHGGDVPEVMIAVVEGDGDSGGDTKEGAPAIFKSDAKERMVERPASLTPEKKVSAKAETSDAGESRPKKPVTAGGGARKAQSASAKVEHGRHIPLLGVTWSAEPMALVEQLRAKYALPYILTSKKSLSRIVVLRDSISAENIDGEEKHRPITKRDSNLYLPLPEKGFEDVKASFAASANVAEDDYVLALRATPSLSKRILGDVASVATGRGIPAESVKVAMVRVVRESSGDAVLEVFDVKTEDGGDVPK